MVEGDHEIATGGAIVIERGVVDDRDVELVVIVTVEECYASTHLLNDVLLFGTVGAGDRNVDLGIGLAKMNWKDCACAASEVAIKTRRRQQRINTH